MEKFIIKWFRIHSAVSPDLDQFGKFQGSSTTHLLISMLHKWFEATDDNSKFIRTVVIDFRKAFNKIDHNILLM